MKIIQDGRLNVLEVVNSRHLNELWRIFQKYENTVLLSKLDFGVKALAESAGVAGMKLSGVIKPHQTAYLSVGDYKMVAANYTQAERPVSGISASLTLPDFSKKQHITFSYLISDGGCCALEWLSKNNTPIAHITKAYGHEVLKKWLIVNCFRSGSSQFLDFSQAGPTIIKNPEGVSLVKYLLLKNLITNGKVYEAIVEAQQNYDRVAAVLGATSFKDEAAAYILSKIVFDSADQNSFLKWQAKDLVLKSTDIGYDGKAFVISIEIWPELF